MKKLIALCLAALFALGCAGAAFAADGDGFVPEIRFVVCSDTHVLGGGNTAMEQRIAKMMELAYAEAAADPTYKGIDALLTVGDLTNDGTKDEFDRFWGAVSGALQPETRFLGVVAKNHDGYEMSRAEMRGYYTSLTGNDADFHVVIGGYHFIGVSASAKDGIHYDAGQLVWLKKQLDAATKEDPNRPVFVMHHEPVRDTVYGSSLYDGWGVTRFTPVLRQYPQVVDLAGHSHYPLNDPRSIWQGAFTAIGTGAVYYSEFTVEGLRTYHPADSNDTSTCWIMELNAAHDLRVRGYDVLAGKLLCEEVLKNPADGANREYTPAKREAASKAPAFAAGAPLRVETGFGECKVTAPAAVSTDGMPVTLYRVCAKNKLGATAAESWVLPSYYRAAAQDEIELTLSNLAAGEYTVYVTAENAYGKQSEPLQTKITVQGESAAANFFTRIGAWFRWLKDFFTHLFW